MQIIKYYSVNNDSYKANVNKQDSRYTTFQSRGPIGLMLHSVGCAQPSAKVFADSWNRSGYEVSVHAVLQADGTVYQCMPWNYRAWHCGGNANNTHIGVEMTEPSQIKYAGGATFTVTDKAAAQAQARGTYNTAVELFAQLCKTFNLNPLADGVIISHNEGAKRGVASSHVDPEHLWKGLGLEYTMDGFRKAVKARMDGADTAETSSKYKKGWNQDEIGWWYSPDGETYYKDCLKEIDGYFYYFGYRGYIFQDYTWEYAGIVYTADTSGHVTSKPKEESAVEYENTYYQKLGDVPEVYRESLEELISAGLLKGKGGEGDDLILEFGEESVRCLVIMARAFKASGLL